MLFDEIARTETGVKQERESIFAYLNSSARAPMTAGRRLLEQWFLRYPDSAKDDLRARFRSPIDAQHKSAFWELYLHELFSGLGYALEPHPDVEGSANHPDLLVKKDDIRQFYLEAVVAGLPSAKEAGAEARLAEVFDLVNKVQACKWFLHVEHRGITTTAPPVRHLRNDLEKWLATLDRSAIEKTLETEDWEGLPRFEWSHEGLTLLFNASPRSTQPPDGSNPRPIGMMMGEVQIIETDKDIRRAVESKAKKYGELDLPLVIAVNVVSEHCDDYDINNALLGTESIKVTRITDGSFAESGERLPDGVWFGKKGPRSKTVSAVLVGIKIDVYSSGYSTPVLVHHPYPNHRLDVPSYRLPESVPNEQTHTMNPKEGRAAREFLRLPDPWPPADN